MAATGDRSHHLILPRGFIAIRILQLIFSCLVLGISIYGCTLAAIYSGVVINLVTALITIITVIYILVSTYGAPSIYNYWAILGLEILCVVFWLVSFALLASGVADLARIVSLYSSDYTYFYYYYYYYDISFFQELVGIFGACAGIGAIDFILFIVSLCIISVMLHRHRSNGGHCVPGAGLGQPQQQYVANYTMGPPHVNQPPVQPQQVYYNPQGGYVQNQPQPQHVPQQTRMTDPTHPPQQQYLPPQMPMASPTLSSQYQYVPPQMPMAGPTPPPQQQYQQPNLPE